MEPGQQEKLERLEQSIREITARHRRIPLLLGHIKTFTGVAWSAVDGHPEAMQGLRKLQEEVDKTVRSQGFPPAEHRFQPHITLGSFEAAATQVLELRLQKASTQRNSPSSWTRWNFWRASGARWEGRRTAFRQRRRLPLRR